MLGIVANAKDFISSSKETVSIKKSLERLIDHTFHPPASPPMVAGEIAAVKKKPFLNSVLLSSHDLLQN